MFYSISKQKKCEKIGILYICFLYISGVTKWWFWDNSKELFQKSQCQFSLTRKIPGSHKRIQTKMGSYSKCLYFYHSTFFLSLYINMCFQDVINGIAKHRKRHGSWWKMNGITNSKIVITINMKLVWLNSFDNQSCV